jgi:hypothetical protein
VFVVLCSQRLSDWPFLHPLSSTKYTETKFGILETGGRWQQWPVAPYLLTPWIRVLIEKLTSKLCSYSRNFPHLWNPKVLHRTHKCLPPVPILSQLHPFPTTSPNFLMIHLNIILPSTSWSFQWPLSLRLSLVAPYRDKFKQ